MKLFSQRTAFVTALGMLTVNWVSVFPAYAEPQFAMPEDSLIQFVPPVLGDRNRPSDRSRGGASRSSCRVKETQANLTALVPSAPASANETELIDATERLDETELTTASTLDSHEPETFGLGSFEPESSELASPSSEVGELNDTESARNEFESGELLNPEAENDEFVLSLTTETHPSLWLHMPPVLEEAVTLEFVFQDEIGNTLYRTQFTVDETSPGIVQVSLPEGLPPLTIDHIYRWSFLTQCGVTATNGPLHAAGWIVRTTMDADFQAQLANASELEKASLYAANGIWQDALTTLGELYRDDPQNTTLKQNWQSLLVSAGLAEIAEQPLIDCCNSTQVDPSDR